MTLAGFPRRTLKGDREIYRIHRSRASAWWFSADGSGRFDPIDAGTGTCYFAERPLGAWVEVFRKQMLLAEGEVLERSLLAIRLGYDVRLADLPSRRALAFGVTASLGSDQDYKGSQAFAAQALHAGFGGVRYLVRHDPAQRLYGLALFGEPGAGATEPIGSEQDGPIPEELIADAQRLFGYRILPSP